MNYYLTELKNIKYNKYTKEDEVKIITQIQNGDNTLKHTFLKNNLFLVVNIASKYKTKYELEELIQEGNIGLINALNNFKIEKNTKFSTYATIHIHQAIMYFLKNNELIYTPIKKQEQYKKLSKHIDNFNNTFNNETLIEFLINKTNLKEKEIKKILLTKIIITEFENIDNIPNEEYDDHNYELVNKMFNLLTYKEEAIIKYYFGIDEKKKTIKEISKHMNLSIDKVNSLKKQALLRLKEQKINYN